MYLLLSTIVCLLSCVLLAHQRAIAREYRGVDQQDRSGRRLVVVAASRPRRHGLLRRFWCGVAVVSGLLAVVSLVQRSLTTPSTHTLMDQSVRCPPRTHKRNTRIHHSGASSTALDTVGYEVFCETDQGSREGPWTQWSATGKLRKRGHYEGGRLHGPWLELHPSGRAAVRGHFVRGQRHGSWREWFADGGPKSAGSYDGGNRQGRWTEWRSRGGSHKASEGRYVDGRMEGVWWFHSSVLGPAEDRLTHLLGRALSRHRARRQKWTYRANVPHGPFTIWFESGYAVAGAFRNGEADGAWTVRRPDGLVGTWEGLAAEEAR